MELKSSPQFHGIPSFLRALAPEAKRGGSNGYRWFGFELARHTDDLASDDYESNDDFEVRLGELRGHVDTRDWEAVWLWYKQEYPKVMALVPDRRKDSFLEGVFEAVEADKVEF